MTIAQVIGPAIAVYVAIRVDLAVTKDRADRAIESADEAHRRIDDMMGTRRRS